MTAGAQPGLIIARSGFTSAGRDFLPGDLFTPSEVGMDDRRTQLMLGQGQLIFPLTRQNYLGAMKRREPGTVGRGFTREALVEMGILTVDDAEPPKPQVDPDAWQPPENAEMIGNYWLVPIKVGAATSYSLVNALGDPLRAKPFKTKKAAGEFVDELGAQARANAAAQEAAAASEAESTAEPSGATDAVDEPENEDGGQPDV